MEELTLDGNASVRLASDASLVNVASASLKTFVIISGKAFKADSGHRDRVSTNALDTLLWDQYSQMNRQFRTHWEAHDPTDCGKGDDCKKALVCDGHHKWRRPCCPNENGSFIRCPMLGDIMLPCTGFPADDTTFCRTCLTYQFIDKDNGGDKDGGGDAEDADEDADADEDEDEEGKRSDGADDATGDVVLTTDDRALVGQEFTDEGVRVCHHAINWHMNSYQQHAKSSLTVITNTLLRDRQVKYTIYNVAMLQVALVEEGQRVERRTPIAHYFASHLIGQDGLYRNKRHLLRKGHASMEWSHLEEVKAWMSSGGVAAPDALGGSSDVEKSSASSAVATANLAEAAPPSKKRRVAKPRARRSGPVTRAMKKGNIDQWKPKLSEAEEEDEEERNSTEFETKGGRRQPRVAILAAVVGTCKSPDGRVMYICRWSDDSEQILDGQHVPAALIEKFEDVLRRINLHGQVGR